METALPKDNAQKNLLKCIEKEKPDDAERFFT